MPISEQTFADRLGRGELMEATISGFGVPFTPTDTNIQPPNFQIYLDAIKQKNLDVQSARSTYTTGATERMTIVKTVKTRSGMTRSYVDSVGAYNSYRSTVRNIVKKILNYKTAKPKPPAGETPPKKRNKGEQSFADIAGLFDSLISAVSGIVGYMPTNTDLQIPNMTTLYMTFNTKNADMDTLASNISVIIGERFKMYEGNTGLRNRMLAIKAAVRAQYGSDSPEYNSVKGIKV